MVKLSKLSLTKTNKSVQRRDNMKGPNCTVTCPSTLLCIYSCFNCLLSHVQWFLMSVELPALANFCSIQTCSPVVFKASNFSLKSFQLIWPDPIPMEVFSVFSAAVRNTSLWDTPKCQQPAHTVFWRLGKPGRCFQPLRCRAVSCLLSRSCLLCSILHICFDSRLCWVVIWRTTQNRIRATTLITAAFQEISQILFLCWRHHSDFSIAREWTKLMLLTRST